MRVISQCLLLYCNLYCIWLISVVILSLFFLPLLYVLLFPSSVGVVFAFLTNQQVFNVVSEVEETVNASLLDLQGFYDDSLVVSTAQPASHMTII